MNTRVELLIKWSLGASRFDTNVVSSPHEWVTLLISPLIEEFSMFYFSVEQVLSMEPKMAELCIKQTLYEIKLLIAKYANIVQNYLPQVYFINGSQTITPPSSPG